ncbi:hypothetical protein Megpolyxen_01598 (plasmid) [Candidatus Megaera polyxenophila]|nr:hypothetical protein Megpolyxen_01598 [Candidatus Megaera polyxenophila]
MYNPIKTITSVLIIATFKFVLVFGNSEIVLASSRFASNYSCSDTGKVYRKRCIKTNGRKRRSSGDSKRNTGRSAMIAILRLIVFCVFCLSVSSKVIATSYRDPTSKTNVNVQTDLFRKSVGDVEVFKSQVQEEEREAIEKLRSGGDHGVEFISGTSRKEIDENTSELSALKADELNDRGSTQLLREKLLEEIYLDESNPLMVAHRKDAERIAEGSKDLLGSLLLSLKERLGVDCYTVKGNKEIDPEHHIKLKEQQIRETIYDQATCEEPRNRYNCHDVLTTKCKRRGAVGDLKYVVRGSSFNTNCWLGNFAHTKLRRQYDFFYPRDGEIDLVPFFLGIKELINRRVYLVSGGFVPQESIVDVNKIVLPPQRYIPYKITLQQRTGEWIEKDFSSLPLFYGSLPWPLFYYDEGCVEWIDEWDEVCGLES